MNSDKSTRTNWQGLVPRGRSAIISLVFVAVVAFFLGGFLYGGDDSSDPATGGDIQSVSATSASVNDTIWTCSMHPQIRMHKPGKCPICFMDLIPVTSGGTGDELAANQIRMSATAVKLAQIETTPVTRAFAERAIRMVGKLDYDESKVAYITAWVPGRLDKLFVDYTGGKVTKGEHMVHMYSPELIAAQEELLQAQDAVHSLSKSSSDVLKSTANETLKSAREKLRLYGLSDTQITAIEQSKTPSDHLTITAPTSGTVIQKDAREGMYVSTGTRIYTIADLSELWVMFDAYESDLPWLKYGQHLTFTSPSFPGETFDAVISFIDPTVDPKTRTVTVRAVVGNKDGRLKPDMFVSGMVKSRLDAKGKVIAPELAGKWIGPMHPEIVQDHPGKCPICGMDLVPASQLGFSSGKHSTEEAPLLIPATAPLITGTRAVVYVKVPGDSGVVFEGREVTLGPRAQDYYVVKSGLKEGELVVTNGAFKIDSELQIEAKPSMMSPASEVMVADHKHDMAETASPAAATASGPYAAGTARRIDVGEKARSALEPVYKEYFGVQMALAGDDLDSATAAYGSLGRAVKAVDMSLFTGDAHHHWMKIMNALTNATDNGQNAKTMVQARDAFFHLSLAAIEMHDTFGHAGDDPFYLTFCPMARDNAGAYWIQTQNVVWNPFYGHKMLRCGSIKQSLPAGNPGE